MSNNFILGSDPLLYSQLIQPYQPQDNMELKRQLDNAMIQYQQLQQQNEVPQVDHLGELDNMLKSIPEDVLITLSSNEEFNMLNNYIQQSIQAEILKSVKWKLNNNQEVIRRIDQLKQIVKNASKEKENEDKKNMLELNDYIKNYSDLTFNEYKQLKGGK